METSPWLKNQDDMLKLNLGYLKMDFDRLCNAHWDLFKIKNLLTDWREYGVANFAGTRG